MITPKKSLYNPHCGEFEASELANREKLIQNIEKLIDDDNRGFVTAQTILAKLRDGTL